MINDELRTELVCFTWPVRMEKNQGSFASVIGVCQWSF